MKTLVRCASLASVVAVVVLLYDGRNASDPLAVAVADAAVRCPDGFTVNVRGLPAGSTPTSSLSDSCVLDLGIPAGATGPQGPAGTPGINGVSGYALSFTTVKSSKSKNSQDRLAAVAECPAGKKAIGGGASITAGRGAIYTIMTSEPTPNGQGWLISVGKTQYNQKTNDKGRVKVSDSQGRLKVTAICVVVE